MTEPQETGTKRKIKFTYVISAIAISCLMIGTAFGMMISATTPSTPTVIEPGSMVSGHSFVVFQSDGSSYAKNGSSGAIAAFGNSTYIIQWALTNIPSSGGTVVVQAGNYPITRMGSFSIRILKSNIHLELQAGALLRLADSQWSAPTTDSIIQIGDASTTVSNITISGPGVIDGNEANNHPPGTGDLWVAAVKITSHVSDVHIFNLGIRSSSGDAIWVYGESGAGRCRGISIQNCILSGNREGILFEYADDVTISDNWIYDTIAQDGIEPAGSSQDWIVRGNHVENALQSGIDIYNGANNGIIEDNILVNCDGGVMVSSQGAVPGAQNILIKDNIIHDSIGHGGIEIWVNTARTNRNITISGNDISNTYDNGIYCGEGTSEIQIDGNYIHDVPESGIVFTGGNGSIRNNIIRATGEHAINVIHVARYLLIEGNRIEGTTLAGIQVGSATNSWGNTLITGNYINNSGNEGIVVQYQTAHIIGNFISNSYYDGIWTQGSDSEISNNICKNNDQSNSANGAGIRITYGDNLAVLNNQCFDDQLTPTQDIGIYVQGATNSLIQSNQLFGNQIGSILDQSGAGTAIKYNMGWASESAGSATIVGSTSTTFNHNLSCAYRAVTLVLASFNSTGAGAYTWTANGAQITITVQNSGYYTLYWYAQTW